MKIIKLKNFEIGHKRPFILISGPCVIQDYELTFQIAQTLKHITQELDIPFIFKASYDKANRSSIDSYRGVGIDKGLEILEKIKNKLDIPILTDVHEVNDVKKVSEVVDIIQVPAFLCRQTDLLVECGKSNKIVNIKKGQFISPYEVKNIIKKIESTGNTNIIITERGFCFGYNNLINDFRSIPIMQETGHPIIFDASHSSQLPGNKGDSSGGNSQFIPMLAKCGISAGSEGIFMETHFNPQESLCDNSNMLKLKDLPKLLKDLKQINQIINNA